MKKILSIILSLILLLSTSSIALANNDITVKLDGETLEFDVPPQLIGGRTMVPLRVIFESLGAVVEWDNDTSTVTAYNEFYLVKATIGNNTMLVNGTEKQIDVPPMIVESRTLVPARFVAEAFNCNVEWDGDTKTVYITSGYNDYSRVEQPTNPNSNVSLLDYYDNTHIPTYTSVTGRKLEYNIPTSDGEMIYVYSYDKNSADAYVYYLIHHNWWQTNVDNDANGLFCFYQNNQYREKVCVAIDEETRELQIITLTNFQEETNNNSNSNSSTQNNTQYYTGTHIPTYSSITNYYLKDTYITDTKDTMYIYAYDENAVKNYVSALNAKGWETAFSQPNEYGNYIFILKNNTDKEQVSMLISFADNLVYIVPRAYLYECYPGTTIPTYTTITGKQLLETTNTPNNVTIYSYVEDENSLTQYLDYMGNNGWNVEVVEGYDTSHCYVNFTGKTRNDTDFVMSVEFAYGEIWIYIED